MSNVIQDLERAQLRNVPRFKAGDTVRVHFQVIEGQRRRVQVFEGIVLKRQGAGARETFTVRKQSFGVGVERTFPLHSPKIERIEVAAIGDVNRAKLYYLRGRVGKKARVRGSGGTEPARSCRRRRRRTLAARRRSRKPRRRPPPRRRRGGGGGAGRGRARGRGRGVGAEPKRRRAEPAAEEAGAGAEADPRARSPKPTSPSNDCVRGFRPPTACRARAIARRA